MYLILINQNHMYGAPAEQKIWKTDVTFLFLTSIYIYIYIYFKLYIEDSYNNCDIFITFYLHVQMTQLFN
jgi:hypothetical protein